MWISDQELNTALGAHSLSGWTIGVKYGYS